MKNKLLLVFMFLLLASCSSDDSVNIGDDEWVLTRVICFCFFEEDFDFSTHSIQFNDASNIIIIDNTGDTEFLAPSGAYSYTKNGDVLTLENGRQYRYLEEEDTLILTYVDEPGIADDEITYYYRRN